MRRSPDAGLILGMDLGRGLCCIGLVREGIYTDVLIVGRTFYPGLQEIV